MPYYTRSVLHRIVQPLLCQATEEAEAEEEVAEEAERGVRGRLRDSS